MEIARTKLVAMILIGEAQERFYQSAVQYGISNIHCAIDMSDAVRIAQGLAKPLSGSFIVTSLCKL